ncbi:MAG: Xylose isomerase domain protein barrel [Phycisphaerales bacterium]|nr:Xylose isomerase domain protein barrel [Phycisphaerales bacterium]
MPTRTANLPIAFRRLSSEWNKDLRALLAWAKQAGFEGIDLNQAAPADVAAVRAAGLRLGSVDLIEMGKLLANDPGQRKDLVARNVAYIGELAAAGAMIFFTVLIPGDPTKKRSENYALAVDTFGPIAQAAADAGVKIVIEGWPGPAPYFPALCCTPESYRAFIRDTNPTSVGVNYDPSHLIRLGVDPIRFLQEFVPYVHHVHAKDTQLFPDAAYELGLYQDSIARAPHRYGSHAWRYTIPGRGQTAWTRVFEMMQANGYRGAVSVELEDEEFNGSEEGEKKGLIASLEFLRGA